MQEKRVCSEGLTPGCSAHARGSHVDRDFRQLTWDDELEDDCRELIRLAVREDLERGHDWTTVAMAAAASRGGATFGARESGVVAGIHAARLVVEEMNLDATWTTWVDDGEVVEAGKPLAQLEGSARDLLTAERLMLNLLGRLCGIATLTRQYVTAVAGTHARVYDTRKTTPGWRRLEKHAVHCGGGRNHRTGLFDAVLIKDNHLQLRRNESPTATLADAVRHARQFLGQHGVGDLIVEIEVDTLDQLRDALQGAPDIVLLDNMTNDQLREAVQIRAAHGADVELEASGGVNLATIRGIAETGVDRISVGALTHSSRSLDIGLDWSLS
ncbi:MAG: carboxylating nicotinate-nucleotide diphosphorylase [Planctomycetales bacterium]|nr:carboxylating nicotinate-nucleotide diphosphorylase [Planctomycetales bacterium]